MVYAPYLSSYLQKSYLYLVIALLLHQSLTECLNLWWLRQRDANITGERGEIHTDREIGYAATGGMVVVPCFAAIWRKNKVSSLSQMVGEFILISAVVNLLDEKRKITSSTVNEFSLNILRRSNLGVCNSSIFLGRVSSMRLGLMYALKSLLLCSS